MEAEDRISEVEDRMVEISKAERKKEKRIKRNEDNLRDLWDYVKCPNIQIIGVPEKEDKKKGHEKILEEIIVENLRKVITNLDSIFKSRDITFPTKVRLVKAMVFPMIMYGCESWTVKKAECKELMLLNCGVGEDS